jgi:F-type H+-transporting ATPase subunit epsilon
MARLTLTLVTPTQRILEVQCDEVRAPGAKGSFGVRPGHEPFLTTLDAGGLRYFEGTKEDAYAVVGGFAEVSEDRVLILADEAVHVEELDAEAEKAALKEAERRLAEVQTDAVQRREASARVRRHAARLSVARKR